MQLLDIVPSSPCVAPAAYTVQYNEVRDKWIARCDSCSLMDKYELESDASARCSRHNAGMDNDER